MAENARAIDVANAVKAFLWEYGSGSSAESKEFYEKNVFILTPREANEILNHPTNADLVVTLEGMYDWPMWAWAALKDQFPEWLLENINGWAMGIYKPVEIPQD